MNKAALLSALLIAGPAVSAQQAVQPDEAQQGQIVRKAIEEDMGFASMSPKGRGQLLKRVLASRERFLDSSQPKAFPETLYRFFRKEQYELMEGNPILGYFYVDKGFRWPSDVKTVQFQGCFGINEAQSIRAQAYRLAIASALRHMGMSLGPSPIKVKGCAVSMSTSNNPQEPQGVWMEIQVASPNGSVFYRLGIGKKTVGDSLGADLESTLRFAYVYADGSLPRPKPLSPVKR